LNRWPLIAMTVVRVRSEAKMNRYSNARSAWVDGSLC
jgi:hypothetical protein